MHLLGKITVTTVIPEPLKKLEEAAYNLWWSWNPDFLDLYRDIDNVLWDEVHCNPVKFLQEVSRNKLEAVVEDREYMKNYNRLIGKFEEYISNKNTWFLMNHSEKKEHFIAYFSAEYGFSDILPLYSGGLGILSGDHCKSASDLGLPFAGIGLFYSEGYFDQKINRDGWQETFYKELNVTQLPLRPARDVSGNEITISVELADREVYAKVWELKVGRISVYFLDTNVYSNTAEDRTITARLYGGDPETRIRQEILLGIGGIRVLDALGIKPAVFHMNEGHSSFLVLELIRKLVQKSKLTFREAREVVYSSAVFTTHTPVPAGNDVFPVFLIDKYFNNYWDSLGISRHEFLDLGLSSGEGSQDFNMAILALNLSGYRNGVSELHGAVSRNIYSNNWPGLPEEDIPIYHVTNGIHLKTWIAPEISSLIGTYTGTGVSWESGILDKEMWEQIGRITDEELWQAHTTLKRKAIDFIKSKIKEQAISNRNLPHIIQELESVPDPNALTIGFARRFTSYKRANLIFRNIERIKKILNNGSMPVQIIFAGKAHPADQSAHEIIKNISDIAGQEGFTGKVFLIENYNIVIAKALVQGCDIWLNNPRRPLEASGTSGQKAGLNGVLNFSIQDGWWVEGFNSKNGWVIGSDLYYDNEEMQDNADNESMLALLEDKIIPLYYSRNDKGIPEEWIRMMKESIKSIGHQFSTARMVKEYFENAYYPCMERIDSIIGSDYDFIKKIAVWKSKIEKNWRNLHLYSDKSGESELLAIIPADKTVNLSAIARMEDMTPSDIKVDICFGKLNRQGMIENYDTIEMSMEKPLGSNTYLYSSSLKFDDGGEYGYSIRAIPYHPFMIGDFDLKLIRWAT